MYAAGYIFDNFHRQLETIQNFQKSRPYFNKQSKHFQTIYPKFIELFPFITETRIKIILILHGDQILRIRIL